VPVKSWNSEKNKRGGTVNTHFNTLFSDRDTLICHRIQQKKLYTSDF
jgi:hypothetical protein